MDIIKFWAKTSPDKIKPNAFHPLICHLIDVAAVTQKIWQAVLPNATKNRINNVFGVEDAGKLIAFIAGLHDLGKCSPPFTLRGLHENKQTKQLLRLYEGTDFKMSPVTPAKEAPHGYVTTIELPEILQTFGIKGKAAEQIGVLIGGHHGVFPNSEWRKNGRKAIPQNLGNENWTNARIEVAEKLAGLLGIEPLKNDATKLDNATIMILAGLVSVADWIGSDTQFFKCAIEDFEKSLELNLDDYFAKAEKRAEQALYQLGWLGWAETDESKEFLELFPKLKKHGLRQLQKETVEIADELTKPGIVVIESPTGEGKTEAAMFLADTWNTNLEQTGIYFALPTQATSNQMFTRVVEFLEDRFKNGKVQTQLLHGKSIFSEDADELKKRFREELEKKLDYGHQATEAELKTLESGDKREIHGIHDENCGDCIPSVVAAEWFTARKRGLLAPFGVGTVDQALMAVLQTKHVFVRLFGLAHKTIIIDEVHAYDAYMSTLLERLLEWLAALGSPVILLSATLPRNRRDILVKAYGRGLGISEFDSIGEDVYPRISYATDSTIKVKHIETSDKSRTLFVKKVDENFVKELKTKLQKDGGCAAIVCNTVHRSQDIYDELSKDDFFKDKIDLLHARFRFIDREKCERRVLERFGKPDENGENSERPKCAVLIATQIIEQSLDIDFDVIISDLAPIDLLLQRAGRLHRHERRRTDEFKTPTLWLIEPKIKDDGLPNFENSIVYDEHILLRTWLELNKKEYEKIKIPDEVEKLIEAVYGKEAECLDENFQSFWDDSKKEMNDKLKAKRLKAKNCRITDSDDEDLFENDILQLDEDKPEIHKTLQALTRDDEMPSVSVVVLTVDEAEKVNLKARPNRKDAEFLLKRETKITKKGLTNLILVDESLKQKSWKNSPLLRHHRLLQLDENNKIEIGSFTVSLDEKLGIVIQKGEKNGE